LYKSLTYHFDEPVATITLERPENWNCVDLTMAQEIRQAVQQIREQSGALVAMVTGTGDVFSKGRARLQSDAVPTNEGGVSQWLHAHQVTSSLAGLPMPVIAVVNGDATDHGLELALACDLRIVSSAAYMGFSDLSQGTLPWDGGTQRLPRLVGKGRALDMILTSRLVDATEAVNIGLANMVVNAELLPKSAYELASQITAGGPVAAAYVKEAVFKGMDMTLEQGLTMETDLNLLLFSTKDREEGLLSFKEKRNPRFRGR